VRSPPHYDAGPMESMGSLFTAVVWGGTFFALLLGVLSGALVVRWRRREMAALRQAEEAQSENPSR
jgi:hypothetical protein